MDFVDNAIAINEEVHSDLLAQLKAFAEVSNPNSPTQMKRSLVSHGLNTASLEKAAVADIVKKSVNPLLSQILSQWQSLKKTSVASTKP